MNYKTQFPDYTDEIPTFEGFEDTSWRDDVCPSFQKHLGGVSLRVWVGYADPENREDPDSPRFALDLITGDDAVIILNTDDLDLVRFVIDLVSRGGDFLCSWNDSLFEVHSKESLRRDYGSTNLFEPDSEWASGEVDFEEVLHNLETGRYVSDQNDNMRIFRLSAPIKEVA